MNKNKKMEKPPIGLIPKSIWHKNTVVERINEIFDATKRYSDAKKEIPKQWMLELQQLFIEFYSIEGKIIPWEWIVKMQSDLNK